VVNRAPASAAVALGGFISVVVLLTRLGGGRGSILDIGDPWRVLVQGDTACVTLAAVIAVVAAGVLRDRTNAVAVGLVGLLVLGAVAVIGTSATWSSYSNGVAAGLVIAAMGCLTTLAGDRGRLQGWLIAGALAGALLAVPLEQYRPQVEYSGDYTPSGTPPDWPLVIGAGAAIVLLAASWFTTPSGGQPPNSGDSHVPAMGRTLALGIGIPVTALLLWWWFITAEVFADGNDIGTATWPYGILLVPLVVGGALWLPGRDGLPLVAVLATVVAGGGLPTWQGSWPMLLVFVALIVGGMLTGRRWPHPMIAVGVLIVCALATAIDEPPWDMAGIIAAFVVPAAGGHAVAACLPTTAALSTVSITAPAILSSVAGITVGWVAYSYGSFSASGFSERDAPTTEVVLSLVTIAACAAAIAYLTSRRPSADITPSP
jgi:MFS family permease